MRRVLRFLLNHITGTPETTQTEVSDGVRLQQVLWRNGSNVEVELVAIHGGGHGIPQPYRRSPRILGPTPREPNGPAVIWAFFERQGTQRLNAWQVRLSKPDGMEWLEHRGVRPPQM